VALRRQSIEERERKRNEKSLTSKALNIFARQKHSEGKKAIAKNIIIIIFITKVFLFFS
jgi:hypothetical protein